MGKGAPKRVAWIVSFGWLLHMATAFRDCRILSPRKLFLRFSASPRRCFLRRWAIRSATSESSSFHNPASDRRRLRISYITDVEGDADYLKRYVEQSKVLCFRPVSERSDDDFPYPTCMDFQRSTDSLVFGGDMWDQGGRDLYVIRQFLNLKRRCPDRVHFVMGNRDINKMRIVQELGEEAGCTVPPSSGVYWLRGSGKEGDPENGPLPTNDAVKRLQWMLAHTMGSPRAFQYRKCELEQERIDKGQHDPVTDQDVVESYRQSCHPTGEMGQFLAEANLMVRLGEVAFLHGALPLTSHVLSSESILDLWDDLTFAMPWLEESTSARDVGVETIDDWIVALNDFARENVSAFRQRPSHGLFSSKGGYHQPKEQQPFGQLLQYGMGWTPDGVRNPTVVYSGWCTDGMPRKFYSDGEKDRRFVQCTRDFFRRTGVRLLCSGHQPQGDVPNAIRIDSVNRNEMNWILDCDTSYSGDTQWLNLPGDSSRRENVGRGDSLSGRGPVAVSEVIIEQCSQSGKVLDAYCHGTLSDGTDYRTEGLEFDSAARGPQDSDDLVVGTLASGPLVPDESESPHAGPWWTRAVLSPDGSTLLTAGKGFEKWNRILSL